MRRFRRRWLPIALCAAVGPLAAQPPEEPPSAPEERVFAEELEVTEVLLDVLVTDREGQIILGLGADDFVVLEGREPVEVSSAVFYSSKRLLDRSKLLSDPAVAVDVVPQDRFFIVFVQVQRSDSLSRPNLMSRQIEAGRQVARWLAEEAQPADRVAVVSYRRSLKIHQDFTTDRPALARAIEDAFRGRDPEAVPPSRDPRVPGDPVALATLPAGKPLRRATTNVYQALRLVARGVDGVAGRKNLVFFGRGFGEVGTFGNYQPQRYRLDPTLEALNDANVAVYTFDITAPGLEQTLRPSLHELAAATGGRFYYDRWSLAEPLKQISDLTSGYYLLAYQSRRPAGASGFQRVRVGVRNPELRVQARGGYLYGQPP